MRLWQSGLGTRPMTDRLKTSLFNILSTYGFEGVRVLDLYAGSGSLGIEMKAGEEDRAEFRGRSQPVIRQPPHCIGRRFYKRSDGSMVKID